MRPRPAAILLAASAAAAVSGWLAVAALPARGHYADADAPLVTARGRDLYARHCAACHGVDREGQPDWDRPGPDGRLPAPPHDQTGHSWGHSDEQLFRLTKYGMAEMAAPGYVTNMPAFGDTLADRDIVAIIAFIKSGWPLGIRASQAMRNPGMAGMPAGGPDSDWRFPPSCHPDEAPSKG